MMKTPIRVVLADDHAIIRQGLGRLIATSDDLQLAGSVGSGGELLTLLRTCPCDVVVLDVGLPDIDGVSLLRELSGWRVVMLTARASADLARRALDAGAAGFVVKSNPFEELELAIHAAARGETFVSPLLATALLRSGTATGALTEREREVVSLVADGLPSKVVAERLSISVRTVETHKRHAMRKLGVTNVAGLVRAALLQGINPGD